MQQDIQQTWQQLQDQISVGQLPSSLPLGLYLALGGFLGLYIRFLYNRCSSSPSDSESLSRVFPLLTLATIGVIAVVKSSVALSLGLVGALSIVRFRAAIKDPEELIYLFLCIAVGLALGAEQPLIALVVVLVSSVFIVSIHLMGRNRRKQNILVTITGETEPHFNDPASGVFAAVEETVGQFSLQRLDISNGRSQVRITLRPMKPRETAEVIAKLKTRLPDCEFSYVNITSTL